MPTRQELFPTTPFLASTQGIRRADIVDLLSSSVFPRLAFRSGLPISRKKDDKMNFLALTRRIPVWALLVILFAASGLIPASAQEVLPRPQPPFKGHVGLTPKDSTLDFPQEAKAPKGAPNILLILTDDVGFAASSTFGGPIPTPTMDRLAAQGLRYTQFHTTALCSPTRAALLSGRNHHSSAT